MKKTNQLEDELNKIDNEDIQKFTLKVLKKLPDYFWEKEFINEFKELNGKDIKNDTIISHTKKVVAVLEELLKLYNPNPVLKDILLSAALIHDGLLYGEDGKEYDEYHPIKLRKLIEENKLDLIISSPMYKGIMKAVEGHMGILSCNPAFEVKCGTPEYIFHEADYLASKKERICKCKN